MRPGPLDNAVRRAGIKKGMEQQDIHTHWRQQYSGESGVAVDEKRNTRDRVNEDDGRHDVSRAQDRIPEQLRLRLYRRRLPTGNGHADEDDQDQAKAALKEV